MEEVVLNIEITDDSIIPMTFFATISIMIIMIYASSFLEKESQDKKEIEMAKAGLIQKEVFNGAYHTIIWTKSE